MISYIVVSHGIFASALIRSIELIMGKKDSLYSLELLDEESLDSFKYRLEILLKDLKKHGEVIILSDFPIGTPFNAATMLMESHNFYHLTGASTQMLIALLKDYQALDIDELCQKVLAVAKEQTMYVNEFIRGGKYTESCISKS